jgi:hypothetical protein
MSHLLALAQLDILLTEQLASSAPTTVKLATHLMEPVPHVLIPNTEILHRTVNALLDSTIQDQSTVLFVQQHAKLALMDPPVLRVMLRHSGTLLAVSAHALSDTMNSTMLINHEHAKNVALNA